MVTQDERRERLARARDRGFFFDVDDAAARLCRANVAFGLAKIHWLQERLGIEPDATYISTPDSTVTRNIDRWTSGFGYGGAFEWSGRVMPLELKPNCCGMLAAGLDEAPPVDETRHTIARLSETTIPVDGVAAQWDMHRGNHFINLYRVAIPEMTSGHPYLVIMHSSGSEFRGPTSQGPGLYMNAPGEGLAAIAERMDTPFGPHRVSARRRRGRLCGRRLPWSTPSQNGVARRTSDTSSEMLPRCSSMRRIRVSMEQGGCCWDAIRRAPFMRRGCQ